MSKNNEKIKEAATPPRIEDGPSALRRSQNLPNNSALSHNKLRLSYES